MAHTCEAMLGVYALQRRSAEIRHVVVMANVYLGVRMNPGDNLHTVSVRPQESALRSTIGQITMTPLTGRLHSPPPGT